MQLNDPRSTTGPSPSLREAALPLWPRVRPVLRNTLSVALAATLLTGCSSTPDPLDKPAGGGSALSKGSCEEPATGLAQTLSNGARWSLCLVLDAKRGAVLRDVTFTPPEGDPVPVADEIAIAQLEVPYDTGSRLTSDITSIGFGGLKMQTLTGRECTGERIELPVPTIGDGSTFGKVQERDVVCSETPDAGLAYRSEESGEVAAARRNEWQLWTLSKVGWYEYVARYTFGADGSIAPALGATGDLSPVDFTKDEGRGWPVGRGDTAHAASHAHNAAWRIDWALGSGGQSVQQYDAAPTGKWGTQAPILDGRLTTIGHPATAKRAPRRWWRVVGSGSNADGHAPSYEIGLGFSDAFTFVQDERLHGAGTGYDVAFTNADDCQVYAAGNRGCGAGVLDFVEDGRRTPLSEVVSWVAVGFHHVPRDEDQSPMDLHWQGFTLTPRDLTATRVDPARGREDRNGQPRTYNGERIEDLVPPR